MAQIAPICLDIPSGQAQSAGFRLRQAAAIGMPILSSMEFKKTLMYLSGLLLATGGPVAHFSASDLLAGMKRSWFGNPAATATASPQQAATVSLPSATTYAADSSSPSLATRPPLAVGAAAETMPSPSLVEVLDFNVTVEWVMQRWPRVSTGLPYVELQGYRVPLVTGTGTTRRGRLADLLLQCPTAGRSGSRFGARPAIPVRWRPYWTVASTLLAG